MERFKGRKKVSKYNIEDIVIENGYTYYIIDGLRYTNGGSRLAYYAEFHENHGKKWTDEEKAELVQSRIRRKEGYADISAALGRTYGTCADMFLRIKKKGQVEKYLNMDIYGF